MFQVHQTKEKLMLKEAAREKTKELLNVRLFPLGSFTPVMWRDAHRLMMWWMSLERQGQM
jgi:hypothetical protein